MIMDNKIYQNIVKKYGLEQQIAPSILINLYKDIVNECAKEVEHIRVWDGNLGEHIRRKMGTL